MCEIFALLTLCYVTTGDTTWSLPVKPFSNLCLSIHNVAITCLLLFEFSLWVFNFAFFYNRLKREILSPNKVFEFFHFAFWFFMEN